MSTGHSVWADVDPSDSRRQTTCPNCGFHPSIKKINNVLTTEYRIRWRTFTDNADPESTDSEEYECSRCGKWWMYDVDEDEIYPEEEY